ncbi:MAG: cytochrome P450 [Gammaproteobacteria bacterium]
MRFNLDDIDLHRPTRYAMQGFPWREWDQLREEAPVFRYERDDIEPFWAVTRYADVKAVSENSKLFINGGPRLRLALKGEPELLKGGLDSFGKSRGWDPHEPPDFTFMDDPRHRQTRKLASWAFTQGCMRAAGAHFDALAETFTQEFAAALASTEECDFVHELAAKLPLAATGEIIGLPPNDWKQLLVWSNAILGEVEPEHVRPGESIADAAERNMNDLRSYLEALIREHRAPGGGPSAFINRLVNGRVNGELLNEQQLNSYLFLLIGAGNDTTRNATTGGLVALLEHPTQRDLLVSDPGRIPGAVDEILRWTSPVVSFLRTVTEDTTLNGTPLREGDTVCVFYPSANRDQRVFADPYRFDITRDPNPHLTFGFGAHFCLGANLAKAELRSVLKALRPVLPRIELTGNARRIANTHVSGYSMLGVRAAA